MKVRNDHQTNGWCLESLIFALAAPGCVKLRAVREVDYFASDTPGYLS